MLDEKKVKARMLLMGLKRKDIASKDVWNCSMSTVSQKLNHTRPISLEEANALASLLNLNSEEYYEYFFAS